MPCNGSGYDELNWEDVQKIIKYTFRDSEVDIYIHPQSELSNVEKQQIIIEHHANPLGGYRRIERTYKRVQTQFYCVNIKEDIKDFVEKCKSCQVNKIGNRNVKQPMIPNLTSPHHYCIQTI